MTPPAIQTLTTMAAADDSLDDVPLPLSREERNARLTREIMEHRLSQPYMGRKILFTEFTVPCEEGAPPPFLCESCISRRGCKNALPAVCRVTVALDVLPVNLRNHDPTINVCACCLNSICLAAALGYDSDSRADKGDWTRVPVTHRSQCGQCDVRLWQGDVQYVLTIPDKEPERWCFDCCERKMFPDETPTVKAMRKQ